ncbi:hypothetical protein [Shewanella youngdeokensis]|uniref:Transposase n=1 Tax=Shewanella youngdeokensis TaxID=2999068 RepID=A0ABZ0K2I7_9GAMM|nr:hypothetical protein RGE70_03980 [Shewanella sp. DAU334]
MMISVKKEVYENESRLKIERLLAKISRLEKQLELAKLNNTYAISTQNSRIADSALSADELSMLNNLF